MKLPGRFSRSHAEIGNELKSNICPLFIKVVVSVLFVARMYHCCHLTIAS
jgi:hypothetical protein